MLDSRKLSAVLETEHNGWISSNRYYFVTDF